MTDQVKALPLPIPAAIGIFFDTETTGFPDWKIPSGDPKQPHLTQLAAVVVDLDARNILQSIDIVIRPDGWDIPQECAELNGLTTEYAKEVGVPENIAVDLFLDLWSTPNIIRRRFAYNTTFDNRMIRIATKRYCSELTQGIWKESPYECQMIAARKHLGGKNPKLANAYREICGKDLQNAHTAMADTLACMEIYFALQDLNAESGDMFK